MELWVRSQDKKNLVKIINQIGLNYLNNNMIIANYQPDFIGTQGEYYEELGKYKSKERALEILDEIQNILNPKLFVNVKPSEEMTELLGSLQHGKTLKMKNDFEYKELSTYVYEMPEE